MKFKARSVPIGPPDVSNSPYYYIIPLDVIVKGHVFGIDVVVEDCFFGQWLSFGDNFRYYNFCLNPASIDFIVNKKTL